MKPIKWKWKVVVVSRIVSIDYPSALHDLLDTLKVQGWELAGYDKQENVFIFRQLMSDQEREKAEKERQSLINYAKHIS